MNILTLQVESSSVSEQLKNILSLMKGVKIVSASSNKDMETPNATTLAAMNEAENGKDAGIVCLDSLDSFMASIEG